MAADRTNGVWQAFPRNAAARLIIGDGRWKYPPNPVDWVMLPPLAEPLGLRRCPLNGLQAVVMSPPGDCFALLMPFQADPHRSLYLCLFGRDLKAGETASARARLFIDVNGSEQDLEKAYERYLRGEAK